MSIKWCLLGRKKVHRIVYHCAEKSTCLRLYSQTPFVFVTTFPLYCRIPVCFLSHQKRRQGSNYDKYKANCMSKVHLIDIAYTDRTLTNGALAPRRCEYPDQCINILLLQLHMLWRYWIGKDVWYRSTINDKDRAEMKCTRDAVSGCASEKRGDSWVCQHGRTSCFAGTQRDMLNVSISFQVKHGVRYENDVSWNLWHGGIDVFQALDAIGWPDPWTLVPTWSVTYISNVDTVTVSNACGFVEENFLDTS